PLRTGRAPGSGCTRRGGSRRPAGFLPGSRPRLPRSRRGSGDRKRREGSSDQPRYAVLGNGLGAEKLLVGPLSHAWYDEALGRECSEQRFRWIYATSVGPSRVVRIEGAPALARVGLVSGTCVEVLVPHDTRFVQLPSRH